MDSIDLLNKQDNLFAQLLKSLVDKVSTHRAASGEKLHDLELEIRYNQDKGYRIELDSFFESFSKNQKSSAINIENLGQLFYSEQNSPEIIKVLKELDKLLRLPNTTPNQYVTPGDCGSITIGAKRMIPEEPYPQLHYPLSAISTVLFANTRPSTDLSSNHRYASRAFLSDEAQAVNPAEIQHAIFETFKDIISKCKSHKKKMQNSSADLLR